MDNRVRKYIFVIPDNSLLNYGIINMLKENGYEENKNLFITNQKGIPSWDKLEPEIDEILRKKPFTITLEENGSWIERISETKLVPYSYTETLTFVKDKICYGTKREFLEQRRTEYAHSVAGNDKYCKSKQVFDFIPECEKIIGINLKEKENGKEDNIETIETNSVTKIIEKITKMTGAKRTREVEFIEANILNSFQGMENLIRYTKNEESEKEQIQKIKFLERKYKGIISEEEQSAENSIKNAEKTGNIKIIDLPHDKIETITDRLYENIKNMENIIILTNETDFTFCGRISLIESLQKEFGGNISKKDNIKGMLTIKDCKYINEIIDIIIDIIIEKQNLLYKDGIVEINYDKQNEKIKIINTEKNENLITMDVDNYSNYNAALKNITFHKKNLPKEFLQECFYEIVDKLPWEQIYTDNEKCKKFGMSNTFDKTVVLKCKNMPTFTAEKTCKQIHQEEKINELKEKIIEVIF